MAVQFRFESPQQQAPDVSCHQFITNETLNYNSIIPELERTFPNFPEDPNLKIETDDLPGVYLAFFISYAKENWSDHFFQDQLIQFLEKLYNSEDQTTKSIFLDFALDFQLHFNEHQINIDSFLQKLSSKTKSEFVGAFDFWNIANKNVKRDGS